METWHWRLAQSGGQTDPGLSRELINLAAWCSGLVGRGPAENDPMLLFPLELGFKALFLCSVQEQGCLSSPPTSSLVWLIMSRTHSLQHWQNDVSLSDSISKAHYSLSQYSHALYITIHINWFVTFFNNSLLVLVHLQISVKMHWAYNDISTPVIRNWCKCLVQEYIQLWLMNVWIDWHGEVMTIIELSLSWCYTHTEKDTTTEQRQVSTACDNSPDIEELQGRYNYQVTSSKKTFLILV